jgi:hypothetical protein
MPLKSNVPLDYREKGSMIALEGGERRERRVVFALLKPSEVI